MWKAALAVGCVYEVCALYGPLPTITELIRKAQRHPALRVAVWAAAGGAVWHFYVEEPV